MEKLRALLDVLTERDISEFEHEDETVRIKIVRGAKMQHVAPFASHSLVQHPPGGAEAVSVRPENAEAPTDSADVTSPFVGMFYRAPSPDSPSFVDIGSVVRVGQTLCIVEAMKLMNEIEAEVSGTVVEIFAQTGKAVEFGQKLFRIKKA
ncbi:MAG: acetyl-CoA carboxylase biotin carboxyl carrier protein [Polyangiaceae bacterium]